MIIAENSEDLPPPPPPPSPPSPPPPLSMPDYYFPPGDGQYPDPFLWGPPSPFDPSLFFVPPPPPSPPSSSSSSISRTSILTPAIVASVALIGSAILLVSYYRVFAKYCSAWQVFWGLSGRGGGAAGGRGGGGGGGGDESLGGGDLEQGWLLSMNTGLDESIVKRIPVYVYRIGGEGIVSSGECVVCLGEFEQDDELRVLPKCNHAFHIGCIDVWLRSHSNCPLCRAPVVGLPIGGAAASPPPPPPLLMSPAVQAMDQQLRQIGEEQRNRQHHQQDLDRGVGDEDLEQRSLLPRSRSLSLQLDPRQRKCATMNRVVLPIFRRCRSTGSSLVCYYDTLMLPSPPPPPPPSPPPDSGSNNSAELVGSMILCNLREDQHDPEYVVLDIEVVEPCSSDKFGVDRDGASSSDRSSSSSGGGGGRPMLCVRKPGSFKASLRRSLSTGRVFSFRSFGRSRSESHQH